MVGPINTRKNAMIAPRSARRGQPTAQVTVASEPADIRAFARQVVTVALAFQGATDTTSADSEQSASVLADPARDG